MKSAPPPDDEAERVNALRILDILDTIPEQGFDDLTLLAATVCDTPVSLVSLVDENRQWFKSHHGLGIGQTGRDVSFCAHAILEPDQILEVPDTAVDERFADNPLVLGETQIRFYAGAPLVTEEGHALGTLCVLDRRPRRLASRQREALQALARQTVAQLKLRSMHLELQSALAAARAHQAELEAYQQQLQRLNGLLQEQAITDPLTGVYNRLALSQHLNQALAHARRTEEPLAVLIIDADHFKAFNDSLGHQAGDRALRRLAQVISGAVREADVVARYGGEEFLVILPDTTQVEALALAERIRSHVQTAGWAHRALTVSIGVAARQPGDPRLSAEMLIQDADIALYRAKGLGRNCVRSAADADASNPD